MSRGRSTRSFVDFHLEIKEKDETKYLKSHGSFHLQIRRKLRPSTWFIFSDFFV